MQHGTYMVLLLLVHTLLRYLTRCPSLEVMSSYVVDKAIVPEYLWD